MSVKLVIDAGHNYSGYDTGAVGNGLREQDITYAVGKLVGEALKKRGVIIRYTRDNLTDNVGNSLNTSLSGRYGLANNWKADYFISLHCNAGGGIGAETLVYKLGGVAEGLAKSVQKALVGMGFKDRGIKVRSDLAVLKNTNMPSILIEMGFIDSANDSDILRNRQQGIADAIVSGVVGFLGIGGVNVEHWAKKHLDSLKAKGIVQSPEAWQNFDGAVTRGELLALIDKATNK